MRINEIVATNFTNVFEEKLLKEICDYGLLKNAEPEQIILEIRRDILFIPLIVSGVVKVMRRDGKGKGVFLHYLSRNEVSAIAVSYALENKQSEIRLKADNVVTCLFVPVKVVNSWFNKYNSWREFYFKMNQQQTSFLLVNINDITFENLEFRLIKYLELTKSVHNNETIHKNHFDISRDLRVSRESVSRILKKLEKEGVVILGRNKITLSQCS